MKMLLHKLEKEGLIHPPKWLADNTHYLTIMGSEAYGVSSGGSDVDFYGYAIPPKEMVFPHLRGEIPGFGNQIQRFEQWQEHHVKNPDDHTKTYDLQIFSIVKYFQLLMDNNPNVIDSLFTPRRCITHSTKIHEHLRENRKTFLHKGAYHKFKGYAYSQFSKIKNKSNASNPKRAADIEQYGLDTKFSYHLIRLLNECEQILVEQDLNLERDNEILKSVRRGEWDFERLESWFQNKEKVLETAYSNSTLKHGPVEPAIKKLLLECLEMHYGDLNSVIVKDRRVEDLISQMQEVMDRFK